MQFPVMLERRVVSLPATESNQGKSLVNLACDWRFDIMYTGRPPPRPSMDEAHVLSDHKLIYA